MIAEAKTAYGEYEAPYINNENKALGIDTHSIQSCNDYHTLRMIAEALTRQLNNSHKAIENIERVANPSDKTVDNIHKMTTNYRHQSALLYQTEKRMYEINPIFYTKYIKTKDKGFSYSAMFYAMAEKYLFGWVFSWIDKKTQDNFSF